jgi:hypothetical protein
MGMIGHWLEWGDVVGWKEDNRNVCFFGKKANVRGQGFGLFCLCTYDKQGAIKLSIQSVQQIPLLSA